MKQPIARAFKPKNRRSTRKKVISTADRQEVARMSMMGMTQEEIATIKNMDVSTLRRHFRLELDCGSAHGKLRAVAKMFDNIDAGKEASIFFYLKTQHGYREVARTELTGADGVPLGQIVDAPRNETQEEWLERVNKERERLRLEAAARSTS